MKVRVLLFTLLLTLTPLSTPMEPMVSAQESALTIEDMVGKIETGSVKGKFASIEEKVGLRINRELLVKGDRLIVYAMDKNVVARERVIMHPIGTLILLSGSTELPVGKIKNAAQEIYGEAYVGFGLPTDDQMNKFLPFLQSMADAYLRDPERHRLKVAIIDVVNPYGDVIAAGGSLLADIRENVCRRRQFKCAKVEKIAEIMWHHHTSTSRGINPVVIDELKNKLQVEVIITGHIREFEGEAEVILKAEAVEEGRKPKQVWRRFRFGLDEIGATMAGFDKVTARHIDVPDSKISIRLMEVSTVEGLLAEHFFYQKIGEFDETFENYEGLIEVQDYFIKIDGRAYPLGMGGLFYSGSIEAGTHLLELGYYLARRSKDGPMIPSKKPFHKSIEIIMRKDERIDIKIMGKLEAGYLTLIADID